AGYNESFWYKTYFSTYAADDSVNISSLGGSVTLRETANGTSAASNMPILAMWLQNLLPGVGTAPNYQPWLKLNEDNITPFQTVSSILPSTLRVTAFSGDINLIGNITLSPSPQGSIDLLAAKAINGLQIDGVVSINTVSTKVWTASTINLSDANPETIPGVVSPFAFEIIAGTDVQKASATGTGFLNFINLLFAETGSTNSALQTKQNLHGSIVDANGNTVPLHWYDPDPVHIYAQTGNIADLALFSGKTSRIIAGQDITDVAFYLQNLSADDISIVSAGRDIVAYNASSSMRTAAQVFGNLNQSAALAGDIQISGPGTLEVLAGRNLDLGTGKGNKDGTGVGITSVGKVRNPYLSFEGSDVVVGAGIGLAEGLDNSGLNFNDFIAQIVNGPDGERYKAEISTKSGVSTDILSGPPSEERDILAMQIFYLVLRDSGRDNISTTGKGGGDFKDGFLAINTLFGTAAVQGDIFARGRDIRSTSGGDISIFAPGGKLTLASSTIGNPETPPGIVTEDGGNIFVFAKDNVDIGIGRIFTLRGGNEVIWSSTGNIAAGSSSKTVQTAPPTRVIIDPQSADVQTDLAGLATGGGIGVLATVTGVAPGDVDLIAPNGVVDAGDAGIRASGNIKIAAVQVLNANNIQAAGSTSGVPVTPTVAAPNIAGLTSAANTAGATSNAANDVANQARNQATADETPSDISVEVIGYGGGDGEQASL
ncbi:MAG: filamentous hemagglutinin family protein, partial [Chthoniobacterales bacterium]